MVSHLICVDSESPLPAGPILPWVWSNFVWRPRGHGKADESGFSKSRIVTSIGADKLIRNIALQVWSITTFPSCSAAITSCNVQKLSAASSVQSWKITSITTQIDIFPRRRTLSLPSTGLAIVIPCKNNTNLRQGMYLQDIWSSNETNQNGHKFLVAALSSISH